MGGGLTLAILGMRRYAIPGFASSWQWLERLHAKENGVPYGIALAAAGLAIYPATEIWQLAAAF
jgi:prepilin peptidase CpaA